MSDSRNTRNRALRRNAVGIIAGVLLLAAPACQDASVPGEKITAPSLTSFSQASNGKVANQYIVVFDNSVGDVEGRAKGLLAANNGTLRATYKSALRGFSANFSAQAADAIARAPGVAFVEADQEVSVAGTQSGPPWGLDRIDQAAMPLNGTYDYATTGAGVNVYIIDTGIRRTHVEFGGRVVAAFDGVGDGYGADGCHWHGTHVAGTIGGSYAGVAKGATLHSVRVFGCQANASVSGVIAGIDWVTANRVRPAVASLSISSGYSEALNTAVANSINAGISYAVAAGNNVGDACGTSPASVAAALTVASSTSNDAHSTFSGTGSCVDLYAPGAQIYSASSDSDNGLVLQSGTSMSAAHVAGAAALYLEASPAAAPGDVAQAIISSATVGALSNVPTGTPNRLLRVGAGGGVVTPPPPPPPPPPSNAAPVASFTVKCQKAVCAFDGSKSTDDGGIVRFAWSFGDGASATETSPKKTHTYAAKGNYSVVAALTVSDAAGLSSTVSRTINIKNGGR